MDGSSVPIISEKLPSSFLSLAIMVRIQVGSDTKHRFLFGFNCKVYYFLHHGITKAKVGSAFVSHIKSGKNIANTMSISITSSDYCCEMINSITKEALCFGD